MKVCPKCKTTDLPDDVKHCFQCGYEFTPSNGNSNGPLLAIVIIIVIVFLIFGAASNSGNKPPVTLVSQPTVPEISIGLVTIPSPTYRPAETSIKPTIKPIFTKTQSKSSEDSCPGAPKIQVSINDLVRVVTTNNDRLILRSEPRIRDATEIMKLDSGTQLKIHDGPICVTDPETRKNYWFWEVKVKSNEKMGWVAEGDSGMYYIKTVR